MNSYQDDSDAPTHSKQPSLDIHTCKQKICDLCMSMERKDLVDILVFLKQQQQLPDKLFNQNCDGIKVNLDLVSDSVIYSLYNYVIYKSTSGISE